MFCAANLLTWEKEANFNCLFVCMYVIVILIIIPHQKSVPWAFAQLDI